jgi:hypothetical protein
MARHHSHSNETFLSHVRHKASAGSMLADPDMSSRDTDCRVLLSLMSMQQDAVDFYAQAIEAVKADAIIIDALESLKELHGVQVYNIDRRVKMGDFSAKAMAAATTFDKKYFSILMPSLSKGVDAAFLRHLEDAEENVLKACEAGMDEEVSIETQLFLAEHLGLLGRAHEHIKTLRAAVQGVERHAAEAPVLV